jgi:hypothetical protein
MKVNDDLVKKIKGKQRNVRVCLNKSTDWIYKSIWLTVW